jgi:hypothetical protein
MHNDRLNTKSVLTNTGKQDLAKQITVALLRAGNNCYDRSVLASPDTIAKTACDIVDALDKEMAKRYQGL